MKKYKFTISYSETEWRFHVALWCDGDKLEEKTFEWHHEVFDYISETMCNLQIAGEDWTLSY